MAGTPDKVLSRDFDIAINTGTEAVPVWTPILGLDEDGITISPSNRTTDFMDANDGGFAKPVPIGRGYTVTLKGARMEAASDGTRDPGQAAIEALQDSVGLSALVQFKISSPAAATPETLTFKAFVEATPFGGSDKATWGAVLSVHGSIARA